MRECMVKLLSYLNEKFQSKSKQYYHITSGYSNIILAGSKHGYTPQPIDCFIYPSVRCGNNGYNFVFLPEYIDKNKIKIEIAARVEVRLSQVNYYEFVPETYHLGDVIGKHIVWKPYHGKLNHYTLGLK